LCKPDSATHLKIHIPTIGKLLIACLISTILLACSESEENPQIDLTDSSAIDGDSTDQTTTAAPPPATTQQNPILSDPTDTLSGGNTLSPPPTAVPTLAPEPDNTTVFGLTDRLSLPELRLPITGSTTGDYRLINVYPQLSFEEALLVADVPGENRMVVVEQTGLVKVFDDDVNASVSRIVLNLRDRVVFSGEQGLLGMAFDPDFENNRYVYIYYTVEDPDLSVVSRMIWDPTTDLFDLSSEKIVISIDQPFHSHNGGMIEFSPVDGYLYIALGDGGDGGDPFNFAQNRNELLGKLLRIDVHPANPNDGYTIPPDNPFVGEPDVREEIYAYGFRNPFRFSFDRVTGTIWLGDVGQETREEINVVTKGGNYGWRVFEGTRANENAGNTLPNSAFTGPVHEYGHNEGLAVIGGYVYRGNRVSSLSGRYIYADFNSGVVTALNWDGSEVTAQTPLARVDGPTSFGETADGDLLVVSRYRGIFKFEEREQRINVPSRLSETGLFEDLSSLTPITGMIEYAPAHPFWSDGAIKTRWMGVPDLKQITYSDDDWRLPIGSVAVKQFNMQMSENSPNSQRRLETRVLFHTQQGWQGYTYRWNPQQNDAYIVDQRQMETLLIEQRDGSIREQTYVYPGRNDCQGCHNSTSQSILGLETRQMNTDFVYDNGPHNQIATLNAIGFFNSQIDTPDASEKLPAIDDRSVSVAQRARAYLDVNCSHCHQPSGTAPTNLDLRFDTSLQATGALNERAQNGSLGFENAKIISPGNKELSILWQRMIMLDGKRMPPISSHRLDDVGINIVGRWIDSL